MPALVGVGLERRATARPFVVSVAPRPGCHVAADACPVVPASRRTSSDPSGNFVADGGGRVVDRRSRQRPLHRPRAHRRAEQVARGHDALQRIAGERRSAGQRHVDAEVRTAIRGDQERAVHRLLARHVIVCAACPGVAPGSRSLRCLGLRPVALEHGADAVVAERAVRGQRQRPLGAAPGVDRHRALVDDSIVAVAQRRRRARVPVGQQANAARACCCGGSP